MKIASIYSFEAYPPKGGNHVHALQLMRQFMAAGHDVLTWGDGSVPGVRSFPRTDVGATALESEADILYVRVDANLLGTDPQLVRLLAHTRLPTVWEINAPANETLAFSWLSGQPRAGEPSTRFADGLRRRLHAWKKYPAIAKEERLRSRLAARATATVCVSAALANYAREGLGIADAIVVPNGADHQAVRPDGPIATLPSAESSTTLTVLYTGSPMYPWQGLDVLEGAIALCAREKDPIRFLLLMNQPSRTPIEYPNTLIYVQVPHDEVASYVRAADVGVAIHPEYFWSRWRFHGSPMKMFDYMACGKPVVASDLGQMRELIIPGKNGLLFDNTPADLRRKLLELAHGQHDVAAMGRAAREDVEATHNWQTIASKTLQLFEQAIEAHSRRRIT